MIKDDDGNVLHRVSKTEHVSEKHGNKNAINFSTVDGLNEIFEVQIATGKSVMISFEAWDKNTGSDDLETTWTDLEVPFSETSVSPRWRSKSYTQSKGNGGRATFTFRYGVTSCDVYFAGRGCNSCVTDRYGAGCRTYCKPQSGLYMCSSDGDKICEERRKGEDCTLCHEQFKGENCENCAKDYYPDNTCEVYCPPAPSRYICTEQGQKQCLQYRTGSDCEECISNHYGEDCSKFCEETDNYTCDKSGGKICKEHFYPAGICDINCEPAPGNFTCDQTTGQKICVDGKAGDNCDKCAVNYYPKNTCEVYCPPAPNRYVCTEQGLKQCLQYRTGSDCEECISNHYREDCSKFCEETNNHTCDESGGKICKEHFYPAEKCDVECEPVPANFTCSQKTGQKICVSGKTGNNCDVCENRNKEGKNCEKCKQFFFGPECSLHCKPDGFYNCSSNGRKICLDNTTTVENNCRTEAKEQRSRKMNDKKIIILVAGAGGGGLLLILVITAILLKTKKSKYDEDKTEEIVANEGMNDHNEEPMYSTGNKEPVYSTVNKEPMYSTVNKEEEYSTINKEQEYSTLNRQATNSQHHEDIRPPGEDADLYSHINRNFHNKSRRSARIKPSLGEEEETMYSTIAPKQKTPAEDEEDTYARLERDGRRTIKRQVKTLEDGETYAKVSFVRNRGGGEVVRYKKTTYGGNTDGALEIEGEDVTYMTVTDMVEERL